MKKRLLIVNLIILALLISCNKEKQKPRWELIPLLDKSEGLNYYSVSEPYITETGDIYLILDEGYHEYYTSLMQSKDNGETWVKLMIDGGAFGRQMESFSYVNSALLVLNSARNASGSQQIVFVDLNSGELSSKELPFEMTKVDWSAGGIHFIDDQVGFLGTNSIWKTTDGGENWSNEAYPYSEDFLSFSFIDETQGYALSEHNCLYTSDSGESWDTVFTSANSFTKIQMANHNMGVICGDKVWVTADGGITWDIVLDEKVLDVSMNANGFIYAVSEAKEVFRSINSGADWSKRSSKKKGFISVYANNDICIAGMWDNYEGIKAKEVKDWVLIGRLKN